MATILEQYLQLKSATGEQMASGTLPCDKVFTYQEILYRISVLESCQAFCKTAPITTDTKVLCYHYQIVDAYLCSLLSEHKVGFPANDELKAKESGIGQFDPDRTELQKEFQQFQTYFARVVQTKRQQAG